jgi:hypothetical protein
VTCPMPCSLLSLNVFLLRSPPCSRSSSVLISFCFPSRNDSRKPAFCHCLSQETRSWVWGYLALSGHPWCLHWLGEGELQVRFQ